MTLLNKKTEFEFLDIRIISQIRLEKRNAYRMWWIEIFSFETNKWEKFRDIDPIPKGAVVQSLYEYGNNASHPPLWNRVEKEMEEIKKEYSVIKMYDKFVPKHFIGKNINGINAYMDDELHRIIILKKKQKI